MSIGNWALRSKGPRLGSSEAVIVKVMVLGLRGIPDVQGGVESHAQQLYPRLVDLGCQVEVIVRSPFVPKDVREYAGVKLRRIWSPTKSGIEALVHSFLGTAYAIVKRPDVLHVHAVGPAIVAPLARLFGLTVVMTHHGPDYDREKWGGFARFILRSGERFGALASQGRIAVSNGIRSSLVEAFGKPTTYIPNGVEIPGPVLDSDFVRALGATPGQYVLQVSRLVPEKRQLDLIDAFRRARLPGWKLILAGALTEDAYCERVRAAAAEAGSDVILAGFVIGRRLAQLFAHAGLFVLPSSHEGLPIALLEALSYGVPALASAIPANLEVKLPESSYFELGNTIELAEKLQRSAGSAADGQAREARIERVRRIYDWDRIARETLQVYENACLL